MNRKQLRGIGIAALVLCAVIAVNLLFGLLPTHVTRIDATRGRVVTVSEEGRAAAAAVDRPVTIYYVVSEGNEEAWLDTLVRRYAESSGNITLTRLNPNTAQRDIISRYTTAELSENSLIVVSDLRSYVIRHEDLVDAAYNPMLYYYYQQYVLDKYDYRADAVIAFALRYTTRTDMPVVYQLTGHGETAVETGLRDALAQRFIAVETLNLAAAGSVPADALALIVNKPEVDVSVEESKAILSYLKAGGRMLLGTGYDACVFDNLGDVTAYYGMQAISCLVLDPATGYHYRDQNNDYPYYLLAETLATSIEGLAAGNGQVCLAQAHALEPSSISRDGLNVENVFITSGSAYLKTNLSAVRTLDLEEGDPTGQFVLGMAASEGDTRVIWLSSGVALSDAASTITGGGQMAGILAMLNWMNQGSLPQTVDLPGTSLLTVPLATDDSRMPVIEGLLIALPVAVLILGIIATRRKKAK